MIHTMKQSEKLGFEVTYLPVDRRGFILIDDLKAEFRQDTILVSIMAVNNEIGSMQPIVLAARVLDNYPNILLLVDAVTAVGKGLDAALTDPRIDFHCFSGLKLLAPRGTGFIVAQEGRMLDPLSTGGGLEHDWRTGTENVPAIADMAQSLRLLLEYEDEYVARQTAVRQRIFELDCTKPQVTMFRLLTPDFAPHVLCFAIAGVRGETIVLVFEELLIYISNKCA